ncbi:MAG TPA: ATP-binding cassette domain-containing protein [Clostridiales bacterium]|nr:ATP-binding cassette domain-containing protein [Clostridiales bacterium]
MGKSINQKHKFATLREGALVEIQNLKQYFPIQDGLFGKKYVKAVDDVSFYIDKGETLGLVGESGCGKTTAGRTILRLYEPTGGRIIYNGTDITYVDMMPYRRKMQIVFQDPYASLNPRMTVGDIVGEPIDIHKLAASNKERSEKIIQMLDRVGLNSEHANRYPHEFSGGQRQRIGIARALAVDPEFIVCDEPISALDVSIQAQIVNMFEKLQEEMGLTYLFIAHDLSVVKHISNRIGVMYLGKLVELADSYELVFHSVHPYTRSLISAIPVPDPNTSRTQKRIILEGDVPSPLNPPSGCRFRTRCPYADKICAEKEPEFREIGNRHFAACHHLDKVH